MSHTTELSDGWIAIHDSNPNDVIFRKIEDGKIVIYGESHPDYEGDVVIPYSIIREFVIEQLRKDAISKLEQMADETLLEYLLK
jgi:hypothetical protein